jgi:hypothetical protein
MTDTETVEPFGSTTPTLALPYPAPTDPADVPHDIQALANRIEAIYGQPNGLAGLDSSGKIPGAQLPTLASTWTLISDSGHIAAAAANFDLTAIPQTYAHLRVILLHRLTGTGTAYSYVGFNGDTNAANYASNGTGATSIGAYVGQPALAGAAAFWFTSTIVDIPYYRTPYSKTGTFWFAMNTSGAGQGANAWAWNSAVAINRVTLTPSLSQYAAGCRAMLYGCN